MKLRLKTPLTNEEDRKRFVKFVSTTIEGRAENDVPYQPITNDPLYWTLDLSNNWKIKFSKEDPSIFELTYRYQNDINKCEEALAGWLAVRCNVSTVESVKRGYLFFTTEFPDEVYVRFIPETEKELIDAFKAVDSEQTMQEAREKYRDWADEAYKAKIERPKFHSQTRCQEDWPFNGYEILGTFYDIEC